MVNVDGVGNAVKSTQKTRVFYNLKRHKQNSNFGAKKVFCGKGFCGQVSRVIFFETSNIVCIVPDLVSVFLHVCLFQNFRNQHYY